MKINIYLPDDLGHRAKEEGLNLSRMLRDAAESELHKREAMNAAVGDEQVYEFTLVNDEGIEYTGRLTGKLIAGDDPQNVGVYLTNDKRVLAVYPDQSSYTELGEAGDDLLEDLRSCGLQGWEVAEACRALGIKPVIDL
jgi:hypothetical protein